MSDLKKLFKRDWFYWVIMMVIMTMVVIYILAVEYGSYYILFHLGDYLERQELWSMYPQLRNPDGVFLMEIPYLFLERMASVTVAAALIAQAVRLFTQETQNRTEVMNTFPVKSRNLLTYHYLSGLLTAGIPLLIQIAIIRLDMLYVEKNTDFIFSNKEQLWIYAGKAMIIFMLYYSLLILCRIVTNHVPGTIVTFVIVQFAMQVLSGYLLGIWNNLAENSMKHWAFWTAETVVLILFSYMVDRKKDYARNGFYAFSVVHWMMMGTVFGEVCFFFYSAYQNAPTAVLWLIVTAASAVITAGVHFVTKPKTI